MLNTLQETTPVNPSPLISIIMPLYNSEELVARSISSVLNQTYQKWELVIVDDGSTDQSVEVVQGFRDERIRLIQQRNQGASTARNTAVQHAYGEYLAFLDSDDIWFPEKLAVDVETLIRHQDPYAIIYSNYYSFDDANNLFNIPSAYNDAGLLSSVEIVRDNFITASGYFIHRKLFDEVGGFPTHLKHYEDIIFLLLITRKHPVYPTKQRLLLYRHSLSGKARRKLKDYDLTVSSILESCSYIKPYLSPVEYDNFIEHKKAAMLYSFMMYGYLDSARKAYNMLDEGGNLLGSKKGALAILSLKTGFNFLYFARLVYQKSVLVLLRPWWRCRTGWAFNSMVSST